MTFINSIWLCVYLAIAVVHGRHALARHAILPSWHIGHVVMALAMASMCLPMGARVVPQSYWIVPMGVLALWAMGRTLMDRHGFRVLGALLSVDLCAMIYMSRYHAVAWPPVSFALIAYFLWQAGLWFSGRLDTSSVGGTHPPGPVVAGSLHGVAKLEISSASGCAVEYRITLGAMALGMAYMLAVMALARSPM